MKIVLTHVVLVTSLARNEQLYGTAGSCILESNSIVISVVGEYGLALLSSLERDLQLLNNFNRY